jgi:hypothetical protein
MLIFKQYVYIIKLNINEKKKHNNLIIFKENYKVKWLQDNIKLIENNNNILRINNLNKKTSGFYSCHLNNKQSSSTLGIVFRKISNETYHGEIRIIFQAKNNPQIYLLKIEKKKINFF